ncbi:MAG: hypothetical protein MZV63_33930 [Marinilabiliales bacterium]|nr:hypothetical protein [Marinilabiliales bacterium]
MASTVAAQRTRRILTDFSTVRFTGTDDGAGSRKANENRVATLADPCRMRVGAPNGAWRRKRGGPSAVAGRAHSRWSDLFWRTTFAHFSADAQPSPLMVAFATYLVGGRAITHSSNSSAAGHLTFVRLRFQYALLIFLFAGQISDSF